jgi:hypothetical protein
MLDPCGRQSISETLHEAILAASSLSGIALPLMARRLLVYTYRRPNVSRHGSFFV